MPAVLHNEAGVMRSNQSPVNRWDSWLRTALAAGVVLLWWTFGLPVVPVSAQTTSCTISSTPVAFGNYDVFSTTADDSTGVITYRCNRQRSITVELSTGSGGSYSPRKMKQGALTLSYNLYRNSSRTTIWGNGSSGTSRYSATAQANTTVNVTVYGRIPARQDATVGSYTDTITVTITF